jgi:hypothetical protein
MKKKRAETERKKTELMKIRLTRKRQKEEDKKIISKRRKRD